MKKNVICLLSALAVCSISTVALAVSNLTDVTGHWAQASIERLEKEGVVVASGDYLPDSYSTRADVVEKLVRLLALEEKANISSYKDIAKDAPYYDAFAKAVEAGIVEGYSEDRMKPEGLITREEFVVMLNRMFGLEASGDDVLAPFSDAGKVGNWSLESVEAFVEKGYMNGYLDATLRPRNNIRRAEVDKLLDEAVGMIIRKAGTYDAKDVEGNILVLAKNVTLKNVGDTHNVCAINTTVAKRLRVNGKTNSDKVVTIVEVEEKPLGGGGGGGGSSSSTPTNTVAKVEVTITGSGDTAVYDVKKLAGNIASANKIEVKVGNETVTIKDDATLKANVNKVFESMTDTPEKLETALRTLEAEFASNSDVLDWGVKTVRAMADENPVYETAVIDAFVRGDSIKDVYEAILAAGMSDGVTTKEQVQELIKEKALAKLPEVLPTYAEAVNFLKTLAN